MTYYIEPVDRAELPEGTDWLFIEEPCGDLHFVIAKDSGPVVLPDRALVQLLASIADGTQIPLRVAV